MKKRILIIDGQIFQTNARDRGMGRYSARIIGSILDQKKYDDVKLILSRKSQANQLSNVEAQNLFNGVEVVYLDLMNTDKTDINSAIQHNKDTINEYIRNLSIDSSHIDFLIPSLFQEPVVAVFPDEVKKVIIFYDLIPYLYHRRYQSLMQYNNYLRRFGILLEADLILSISQAVRDDLIMYLGVPSNKIVTIDGAAIKSNNEPIQPLHFGIPRMFVLMPTSDDPRKNNIKAVLGFEEFRVAQNEDYKLIITSDIHQSEQERLLAFSRNIIFTGNIDESELDWLYTKCQAVLFVPETEGLGLPILEAVLANKRVVCSSINVFKEISKDAFYFCNHENQHSIATALQSALSSEKEVIPKEKYESILKHYNWDGTARRAILAIENANVVKQEKCLRIAVFTPTPDGLSAIGKVVAESHPALSKYFDIDYYVENGQQHEATRPNYLKYISNCYPAESFSVEKYCMYDAVVYHIGNSDYHIESIRNSLYLPGIVILHDTNIHEAYRILFERSMISQGRKDLEELITVKSGTEMSQDIASVMNNQLAVLTHSEYAKKAVKEVLVESVPIQAVNLPTSSPLVCHRLQHDSFTIGLAGIIADIKGIEVIEALANDSLFNGCKINLFGYNFASQETTDRLNSYANVSVMTNLSDFEFQSNVSKLDVFVNYRMKYQGETSLSTIEAMRQGVVVIVRNFGWYSELPDNAVVKVDSPEEVIERLTELRNNPEKMNKISKNAIKYITEMHSHEQYADGLLDLVKKVNKSATSNLNISNILRKGNIRNRLQLQAVYEDNIKKRYAK